MEMLVVLFILAILFSISVFGASCYIKSGDYKEKYSNAKLIQTSVLTYASNFEGNYPIADKVSANDKLVVNSLLDSMNDTLLNIFKDNYQYFIYTIDSSKLSINNKLKTYDTSDFLIFYVDENNVRYNHIRTTLRAKLISNGVDEKEVDKKVASLLKSFNGTILFKEFIETCSDGKVANFVTGKSVYNGVSEGLKFEISDDFINCPNGGICDNSNTPK